MNTTALSALLHFCRRRAVQIICNDKCYFEVTLIKDLLEGMKYANVLLNEISNGKRLMMILLGRNYSLETST